jgi:hypothetical protein
MRIGFIGITIGISTAMALRNEHALSSQVIRLSLLSEILTIVILGLIEIS